MVKKISISQLNSKFRQAQYKQKVAINKCNQTVRKHNSQIKQRVNKYNQEIRNYNYNRQKLISAWNSMRRRASHPQIYMKTYVELQDSTEILNNSYQRLEKKFNEYANEYNEDLVLGMPLKETTNSVKLFNSLTGDDEDEVQSSINLHRTVVEDLLYKIEEDLSNRWRGALFVLQPGNPDSTRHFCTSIREIFIRLFDIHAPDEKVICLPYCITNENGKPNRRTKIKYLLTNKAINIEPLEDFIENDIQNIMQLISTLSSGTHGNAGKFDIQQLLKLKKRAEDSIIFITSFAN